MNKFRNDLAALALLALTACTHASVTPNPPDPAPIAPPVATPAPAPVPAPVEKWKSVLTEKPVLIKGSNFASNSARILRSASAQLSRVADIAKQHPEITLEVSGHTDNIGPLEVNQKLSELRAAFVKMWLVDHGVAAERISTAGYAFQKPIAGNNSAAGRAANRRVEIRYALKEEQEARVAE